MNQDSHLAHKILNLLVQKKIFIAYEHFLINNNYVAARSEQKVFEITGEHIV